MINKRYTYRPKKIQHLVFSGQEDKGHLWTCNDSELTKTCKGCDLKITVMEDLLGKFEYCKRASFFKWLVSRYLMFLQRYF